MKHEPADVVGTRLESSLRRYRRRLVAVAVIEDGLLLGAGALALLSLVLAAGDQGLLEPAAAWLTRWTLLMYGLLAAAVFVA